MDRHIVVEYDFSVLRGRMTVNPSDFFGMSHSEIIAAVKEEIKSDAAANAEWEAENMESVVRQIQEALEDERREYEAEKAALMNDDSPSLEVEK